MSEEADRLIRHCAPHLAALVRFALATGCRASEITGLEWARVDLNRHTAWLHIPRDGGHGSMLMADSVPPSSRTPFHGDGGQHSMLKADTPAVF